MEDSEQRFQSFVETTADWVWEVDENLVYSYVSPGVRNILGYEPAEVLGKRPFDFMESEEARRVSLAVAEAIDARRSFTSIENTNIHKLGHPVVLETNGVPFFDATGQFCGYRGIDRNITDRKRAEEALKASERRFRELLETVNLLAVILDTNGMVMFCNEYLLRCSGWQEDEVLGADWFEKIIPSQEREQLAKVFRAGIRQGSIPAHVQNPIVTRGGAIRLVEWDNTLLRNASGDIVGTASLGRDVTDHKMLEEQYRQAHKLESVGRLAGGVAHDFNNLLTVINGYSELLLTGRSVDDPDRGDIERILKAGKVAAGLTQQLLAFSRRQLTKPKPLNLGTLVSEIADVLPRVARERIEVVRVLDPALGPVLADEGQMHQVVLNLVVNACDAMPAGGELVISARNVDVSEELAARTPEATSGPHVLLSVKDSGVGMDEQTMTQIFEPFFTTKAKGVGVGLGLSTAYGIVRQARGWITVKSQKGQGSMFEIYLPRTNVSPNAEENAARTPETLRGSETVLVVEDRDDVRKLTADAVRKHGYRVLEAGDGIQALQLVEGCEGTIDLLLTDVVMPGMDGGELAKKLAALVPSLRVLFMSGYPDEVIASRGVLAEGVEYIAKPFTPEMLLAKVRAALARRLDRARGESPVGSGQSTNL